MTFRDRRWRWPLPAFVAVFVAGAGHDRLCAPVAAASPDAGPVDDAEVAWRLENDLRRVMDDPGRAIAQLRDLIAVAQARGDLKHEWAARRGLVWALRRSGDGVGAEREARENLAFARARSGQLDEQMPDPLTGAPGTVFSRAGESLGDLSSVLTAASRYADAAAALREQLAILDGSEAREQATSGSAERSARAQREQTAAAFEAQLADLDKMAHTFEQLPGDARQRALEELGKARASMVEQQRAGLANLDAWLARVGAFAASRSTPMTDQARAVALGRLGMNQLLAGHLPEAEASLRAAIARVQRLAGHMNALGQASPSYLVAGDLFVNLCRRLAQVLLAETRDREAATLLEFARGRAIARELFNRSGASEAASWDLSRAPDGGEYAKRVGGTVVSYSLFTRFDADMLQASDESWVPIVQMTIAVSRPDGRTTVRSIDLSRQSWPLAHVIEEGRRVLGATGRGDLNTPAVPEASHVWLRAMFRVLVEPIQDLLPSAAGSELIVIPQQLLFLVPFAALEDPSGRPLIESHTLWFQPSLQVAELSRGATARHSARKPGAALVIGNPTAAPASSASSWSAAFPPLPGAEREAVAVAGMLGARPLLRQAADRDTVLNLLPSATVVHLASHAVSDSLNGLNGAVALAARGKASWFLTAQDVLMENLIADLVVLSGCNTSRGRVAADGTIGLVSSFLGAGASTVVASLWSVNDDATTFLMSEFYRALKRKATAAAALRQAMLATRGKFDATVEWAPFVLFGDGSAAPRLVRLARQQMGPAAQHTDCESLNGRAVPLPVDRGAIRNLAEMPSLTVQGRRSTFYQIDLSRPEVIDFYRDVLAPYGFHALPAEPQAGLPVTMVRFACSRGPTLNVSVSGGAAGTGVNVGVQWTSTQ